jgi:hypothetical protein
MEARQPLEPARSLARSKLGRGGNSRLGRPIPGAIGGAAMGVVSRASMDAPSIGAVGGASTIVGGRGRPSWHVEQRIVDPIVASDR